MTKLHFASPGKGPPKAEGRPWIAVAILVAILLVSYGIAAALFDSTSFAGMLAKASRFLDWFGR